MPAARSLFLFLVSAVGGLAAQTPLRLELVATGLAGPLQVTAPPGDFARLFVVEQPGRIRIVRHGQLLPTPFLDLTGTVVAGGEQGLLALAFHPDYAQNRQFFVYHTGNPWPQAVLRRFTASAANPDLADPQSGVVLLQTPLVYGNHNGGGLAFGPDRKLWWALGDGGSTPPLWPNDPFNHAQRGDSLLGKLLRLDVDQPQPPRLYGIPPDNPYVGPGDPRDEIWALGLRNPWRMSFDRLTGDLWLADVGGQREEVDFVAAGAAGGRNFGWACMAGTFCTTTPVCTCFDPALHLPLHDYVSPTRQAIIGGHVYRGRAIPDLRGAYFFADYMTSQIWSLRRGATGGVAQLVDRTVELAAPAPFQLGEIASFGEDAFGELYVCDRGGQVYRIAPNGPVATGLASYGVGTPGCAGGHALAGTSAPVVGNPQFAVECSNGPANGLGFLAFASAPDVAGADPFGLGVRLHLQLAAPLLVVVPMPADAAGLGRYAFAVPATPSLAGVPLYAQAAWQWAPQCWPVPSGWSSSPGLAIVFQP